LKLDDLDNHITTAIPGTDEPELREKVLRHMIHGPCGAQNPKSPCMDHQTRRCSKGYPKPFNEYTFVDQRGYPNYRRAAEEKVPVTKAGKVFEVDSRWVVPYNRHLLDKFACHINVESASSAHTCKYLFKYLTKGTDRALAAVAEEGQEIDEVSDYENRRVLGAAEAHWRMYSFPLHDRYPAVKSLSVHLPGREQLLFNAADPAAALEKTTELQRYLNRPQGELFDQVTYTQYYAHYIELNKPDDNSVPHPDGRHHIKPRVRGELIVRMHWMSTGRSELYFLRLLLTKFPTRSFLQLRNVHGVVHETFQEAARALNLATDSREFFEMTEEAAQFLSASALRHFFLSLMIGDQGTPARAIWDKMKVQLSDDFHLLERQSKENAENSALIHLSRLLQMHGRTLEDMGLPACRDDSTEAGREPARWDVDEQKAFLRKWAPLLSGEQRRVVDSLLKEMRNSVAHQYPWPPHADISQRDLLFDAHSQPLPKFLPPHHPKYFALLAPGGSGKTVALNFLTCYMRSRNYIVLCTASTGIASLNFPGGTTAHSMFKLPFDSFDPDATCSLSMRSQRAELIRQATAIIIDEAFMLQRNSFRAFEQLILDIRSPSLRCIVYVGDLQQIPPVIKWGTKADILRASIRWDRRWDSYSKLTLTRNQRAAKDPEYAKMAMQIGAGTAATVKLPGSQLPLTPLPLIATVACREELIRFAYPNIIDPYACVGSAILAGTNEQIDEWNTEILGRLPGPMETFYSSDHCEDAEGSRNLQISPEVLGSMGDVGVPPHSLCLKLNSVAMLMRNTNFAQRLCNSTKCIVRQILPSRRTVLVEIPKEDGSPGDQLIPVHRITFKFQPGGRGMTVVRMQLPLRPAYCLTHNKSQGQTLNRVGLDLTTDVFSHGQLYVDATRVRDRGSIRVLTLPHRIVNGIAHVLNIVYKELLVRVVAFPV
jgi:hypothetical protein